MVSLVMLIAVQYAYLYIMEKNIITNIAIALIDAAIISTWLTTTGNFIVLGFSLIAAAGLLKALELVLKGISNHAKTFNPNADSNTRQPFDPNAR